MKMPLHNIRFWAAAALACLAAGCGDGGDDPAPVVPDPEPAPSASIHINLLEASEYSVKVRFVPGEHAVAYRYAIGSERDAEAFAAGTLEGTVAEQGGEAKEVVFDALEDGAYYTVYASAENGEGEECEIVSLKVSTPAGAADLTVTVKENGGTSITVAFEPNEYAVSYRYAVGTAADRNAFEAGTLKGTAEAHEALTKGFGGLAPLTEYTVFAQAVNRAGERGEVQALAVTTVDAPYMYVDLERLDAVCAVGTMRFSKSCTGVSAFVCSAEEFAERLEAHAGDTAAMMSELQWEEAGDKTFEALSRSCVPGESRFVAAASLWTGEREYAGWQVREFAAPDYDPSLPLPGKPGVEYMPAGMVLIIRLYGDQNTASLKAVHIRRSQYDAVGDEGVAVLLDETPFDWKNISYTGIYTSDLDDHVCTFVRAYNPNGARGCGPEVYFYEYSLSQGKQVNVSSAGFAGR